MMLIGMRPSLQLKLLLHALTDDFHIDSPEVANNAHTLLLFHEPEMDVRTVWYYRQTEIKVL